MKRLTLLTILLVVVGLASGFALDVKPTIVISGTGTLEWGIDLDTQFTGFALASTADMVVTLASGSDTHAGTDGWYGSIALNSFALSTSAGAWTNTIPTVVAKIVGMGGAIVIGVFDGGWSTAVDFVPAVEADADAADDVVDDEATLGPTYGANGTYVSYTVSEAIMVGLEVVSDGDWTANAANAYGFALDVQAKFAPLTINAGVNYGFDFAANPIGFGVKVAAATDMINPWVAFDGEYDAAFAWEVGAGTGTITLLEGVTASLAALFDSADNLDVMVTFAEAGAKGLVDGLDAGLTVYLLDLITAIEYEVIFTAGYDTGKLYPHFGLTYGDDNAAAATLTAFVHVNYDLFEAAPTLLYVEWNSGDLLASAMGVVKVGVTVTY